jgi:hypothetical protein
VKITQATVEANDKIERLEKQQAQLCAALMAKQPTPSPHLKVEAVVEAAHTVPKD